MTTDQFLVSAEQAQAYEERFVPALFRQWVEPMLQAAQIQPDDKVLDVACGTGVLAREAASRVGPNGSVNGIDLSPAMLTVARRVAPEIDWQQGDVSAMPFRDHAFDVVTCQAAIFFFPDPTGALGEMRRVTRPGGRVVVQAFSRLEEQPAYGPWVDMVARYAGPQALELLGTYWALGDPQAMRKRCQDAGLTVSAVHQLSRPAYFPDVETMVRTEVDATPLGDRLDPVDLDRILTDSVQVLGQFVREDNLAIPLAGYVVVASPT